jgi:hypothetical protein
MIDILNHYTLGFDQDRHIEGFSPGIKCRACLAPYKLSGYGAVAKTRVNIFCFLKKLSNTCPLKLLLHRGGAKLELISPKFLLSNFEFQAVNGYLLF